MHIISHNACKKNPPKKNTKFTIIFRDEYGCKLVARELTMLATDDWTEVWKFFQGKEAKQLLRSAISGLVVFLSCKRHENIIKGEYFSLDSSADARLLASYVHEAQNDVEVNVDGKLLAA